jgi:tetratricopeptide (TPR) repeat protein
VWQRRSKGDLAAVQLAAAAATAFGPEAARAVPLLARCRATAASEVVKAGCEMALASALVRSEQYAEALAVAAELHRRYPQSPAAFFHHVYCAERAGRGAEVRSLLEERIRAQPDDFAAMRALSAHIGEPADLARAQVLLDKLVASPHPEPSDYNQLAWLAVIRGDTSQRIIDLARRGAQLSNRHYPALLHTLAALLADASQPEEAQATLIELLEAAGRDQPVGADWYVVGRIAELYGVNDAATEAYGKVPHPAKPHPLDTWILAERRLRALGH